MQQLENAKRWNAQFDSLGELTRWIASAPRKWNSNQSHHANHGGHTWTLGASYADALRLAEFGWEEGVKNLHALAATVPNDVVVTRTYGVAGEQPDVPRYLAGDPFNMIHRGKTKVPKPVMTIALNTRISAAVGAKEAANFGAAIVALVDHLESRRVRVELLGLMATDVSGSRLAASWTIKRAGDALDLSSVAFSYAHPAMFRRLGFAIMERSPLRQCYGYGFEGGISREDFLDIADGALLIEGVDHNPGKCKTMEEALRFAKWQINDAYRKLGHKNDVPELEDLS